MSLPSVSQNNAHVAVISICARHCKPFFSDWLNKFHFGIKLHFLLLSIYVLMLVEKQVKECGWQEWWEIFIYILFKFIDSHNKKEEHCVLRKVRNTIEKGNIIIVLGSFGWRELRKSSVINDNKNVKSSSISTRYYFSNMPFSLKIERQKIRKYTSSNSHNLHLWVWRMCCTCTKFRISWEDHIHKKNMSQNAEHFTMFWHFYNIFLAISFSSFI